MLHGFTDLFYFMHLTLFHSFLNKTQTVKYLYRLNTYLLVFVNNLYIGTILL